MSDGGPGARRVEIVEVGPRDGLQNAAVTLPPAARAEMIRRLAATGLPRIELASFVNPRHVPQMDGAEEVVAAVTAAPGPPPPALTALVVNQRGYERAVAAGLREVRFVFTVSDEFNRRNAGMSAREGLEAALAIVARSEADRVRAGVVLGASFGCPFTGRVDPAEVLAAHAALVEAGAREIVFADTIGVGMPTQVREFARAAAGQGVPIGFHFHNTRNTGYANAWEAVEHGADLLDASIGGLGGCPFAPGASGNIATEDLAHMLAGCGVETGIDLEALIEVSRWFGPSSGLELDGMVHSAPPYPPAGGSASGEPAGGPTNGR